MDFGSANANFEELNKQIEKVNVKYVSYVYTSFKSIPDFNQENLNEKRFLKLSNHLPELFESEDIEWSTVVQTGAKSQVNARKYFHGFVLFCRPIPTKESMNKEIDFLEKILNGQPAKTIPVETRYSPEVSDVIITEIITKSSAYGDISTSEIYSDSAPFNSKIVPSYTYQFADTTVKAVFNRNINWDKMLIHCDLTGWMSPYSAQLFLWHKLNLNNKIEKIVLIKNEDFLKKDYLIY